MRTDHTTYQLATRVSIAGFILQVVVSLVVLIFGFAAKDQVMQTAGWYMLLGLPVWFTLILLFHQHKLERIEALEADQIEAQQGRSSSIFEESGSDLNLAARRLRWMHQVVVPLMSLFTAIAMFLVGYWQLHLMSARLSGGLSGMEHLSVISQSLAPWGLAISAAIAIGCFVFSRYVSGMSNQRAWRNMRAGASVTVGAALFAASLAVGFGFTTAGSDTAMSILARIFPLVMMLGGIEIAINFVLNLYRPRKAGEFPRPAFDSRILSLVAAPDSLARSVSEAINYQFGFEVTSTWFYRLLAQRIWLLVVFCVAILLALNCVDIVRPYQQAIVTSFGKLARNGELYESGIVWKYPWEKIEAYPVHRVRRLRIGKTYKDTKSPILWGKLHTTEKEDLVIVGPMKGTGGILGSGRANDNVVARNYSVLNFEVPIQYQIKDGIDINGQTGLWNYIQLAAGGEYNRNEFVKSLATRVITQRAANLRIDDVLGPGRSKLAYDLRLLLQKELDSENAGIEVLFVGISGIHPPVDVADSFQEVLKAREERDSTIQKAEAEAITKLAAVAGTEKKALDISAEIDQLDAQTPGTSEYADYRARVERLLLQAGGNAAEALLYAHAQRWVTALDAWTRYITQDGRTAGYNAAPHLYTMREYLLRVSAALAKTRLYIVAPEYENQVTVNLNEDATNIDIGGNIDANEQKYK